VRWLVVADGQVAQAHPGSHAGCSQTPQAYRTDLLRNVTQRGEAAGWAAQSTVELFLRAGLPVAAIAGEKLNLKLTTPEDWVLAEALHEQLSR
jgi:2-C-methyl-D-erythritol 4-phosphate cytidylyltransferase